MTVMTGMVLSNFRGGQRSAEVRFASEILVQQLRDVQTSALTGRLVSVCSGGTEADQVCEPGKNPPVACAGGACQRRVPAGYGVRFTQDATTYRIFYDTNGNFIYDAGEELNDQPFVTTGVVRVSGANVSLPIDVVFSAPNGTVHLTPDPAANILELTLSHAVAGIERRVKLYGITGKVEHD